MQKQTIDQQEVNKFEKLSQEWWDESGKLSSLHAINGIRLAYIQEMVKKHFSHINNVTVLDVGCGGGLATEGMARMGLKVTGVDASASAIEVATAHALQSKLNIEYINATADDMGERRFDLITALEIVEHVKKPSLFIASCAKLLKPGGMIIFSTLNRTNLSYALAVVMAEYVLGWVEKGTHDWNKFVKPSELAKTLNQNGLAPTDITGMKYSPLTREFTLDKDFLAVNYLMAATHAEK